MKYFKSYLYQREDIELLPVKVIEDMLIRISNDPLLDCQERKELTRKYIEVRWMKKQKSFVYSAENIQRMADMNQLLIRQTTDVMTIAFDALQQEKEEYRRQGKECKVEVAYKLTVPNRMYGWIRNEAGQFTEREAMIWSILVSSYDKKSGESRSILPNPAEFGQSWKEGKDFNRHLEDVLCGAFVYEDPELRSWGRMMTIDYEKTKHIVFCWPFQHFLEDECFSMEDILKIDKFNMEIEMCYEIH